MPSATSDHSEVVGLATGGFQSRRTMLTPRSLDHCSLHRDGLPGGQLNARDVLAGQPSLAPVIDDSLVIDLQLMLPAEIGAGTV